MAWVYWNLTAASTCTANTWDYWTSSTADCTSAATTSGTVNIIWTGWNTTGATNGATVTPRMARCYTPPPLSEEEKERIRIRQEERARLQAEADKARKEADERAENLLKRHLTRTQLRQYRRDRSFCMRGRDGHEYRIRRAWGGHIERLGDGGKAVERFCIHPTFEVPLPDNQLIAKLMLETNPEEVRRIANVTALV